MEGRTEGQTKGRTKGKMDRTYFIGLFLLTPGGGQNCLSNVVAKPSGKVMAIKNETISGYKKQSLQAIPLILLINFLI